MSSDHGAPQGPYEHTVSYGPRRGMPTGVGTKSALATPNVQSGQQNVIGVGMKLSG